MKIALLGYGNMGKIIDSQVKEEGKHEVVSISFKENDPFLDKEGILKADVVVDFTSPEIVLKNIEEVSKLGKNMVIGTTGWYDKILKVEKIVRRSNIGLIYGQNFSVGANIFFKIVEYSSQLFAKFGEYDVYGLEVHHTGKKDSPSGTAKKIAQIILDNFPEKKSLQVEKLDRQVEKGEFHFASVRGGRNAGFHEVTFDSSADEVKLSHQAHNRLGFGQGAIKAAQFIEGKRGFYSFDQLFK